MFLFHVESICFYFMWNLYVFISCGNERIFTSRDFIQQEVLKFSENRKFESYKKISHIIV